VPLLWFRRASEGSEPERYTLQVPFQLGPTHVLGTEGKSIKFHLGFLSGELIDNDGIHLLRVTGFPSKADAESFLPKVHGALLRMSVVRRLGLRVNASLQEPTIQTPPIDVRNNPNFGSLIVDVGWTHLDGWVDPTPAVVIPEHLRLLEMGAGSGKVTLTMCPNMFVDVLREGLELPSPERIAEDERLTLAVDLYATSLREQSRRARVITLCTVLEALLEPAAVSVSVNAHIDNLLQYLDKHRDRDEESPEQGKEMDRLRSRLADLRKESISRRLRDFVVAEAACLGETSEEAATNISAAYGVRSELLHEGHADDNAVRKAAAWLHKDVPKILEVLIARHAAPAI
jgi:hypothetical protein